MNVFALDVETTTRNKGNPFDINNRFVLGGWGTTSCRTFTTEGLTDVQSSFDKADLVILFNGKFDLHWCRRIGIKFTPRLPIWDCQLAEYILANQRLPYPSLENAATKYSIGHKLDVVKLEYWEKGIDTDQIPPEILQEYLEQDVSLTYQVYLKQIEEFKKPEHQSKLAVFKLGCYDLLALEEMEWNGYKFDVPAALEKANAIREECTKIDHELIDLYPDCTINFGSNDHVSAILYGGSIKNTIKLPVGTYKTGARAGQVKYQNHEQVYTFPRLVEPVKGSALAKEGYFSTNEDTLLSLSAKGKAKQTIKLLLDRRGLEKLRGTYYEGVPTLIADNAWQEQLVHGNLNQCVTNTGRLSATKPNQQNMSGSVKQLCISRYD